MTTLNEQPVWQSSANVDWRRWAQPLDVIGDEKMSTEAKRALLASWASDANAVPNYPSIRQLRDGRLVAIDNVLAALKTLDTIPPESPPRIEAARRERPLRRRNKPWRLRGPWKRHDDDDDGAPPTAPVPLAPLPMPPPPTETVAAAA